MNEPLITLLGRLTRDPEELRYTDRQGHRLHQGWGSSQHLPRAQHRRKSHLLPGNAVGAPRGKRGEPLPERNGRVRPHGAYDHREYTRQDGTKGCSHDVNCRDFRYFLNRSADQEGEGPEEKDAGRAASRGAAGQ